MPRLSSFKPIALTLSALVSLHCFGMPPVMAETTQALVNRANQLANQENFAVAIPLYEQIIQQTPGEKTLRRNLSVLYSNYAVRLQGEKKYAEADALLDKALLLEPGNAQILEGKAAGYFYQALDLKEQGSQDFAKMRALIEKAIAIHPQERAFTRGLASVCLEEAYQLAIAEQFAEAAPILEKARGLDPDSATIRQSLANVYLGLAKQAREKALLAGPADGKTNEAEPWIAKALELDNSPRTQQAAEALRKNEVATEGQPQHGFLSSTGFPNKLAEVKSSLPAEAKKLSVAEMMTDIENGLGLAANAKVSLMERLQTAEEKVYGQPQSGALATRTKDLYTAVLGGGAVAGVNPELVQAPVETSEHSYLADIFKITDGKVIRWGKFPLRVYIDQPKDNPKVTPELLETVRHGLNVWKVKTNGFVSYVEVKNPDAADVQIGWGEQYVDRFADPEKVPSFYQNYTPPKNSPVMRVLQVASMLTPGYFSLAPQALNAAMQYREYKKLEVLREESKITLGLAPLAELPPEQASLLLQNMAAKEFGHVLGLKAQSPKQGDLMYPELKTDIAQLPSDRDLETLRQLYNRPPNIILNVR